MTPVRAAALAAALAFAPPAAGAAAAQDGPPAGIELEIVAEHNLARTNPAGYAGFLRAMLTQFEGTLRRQPGQVAIRTQEGAAAVQEAIAFLERQAPIGSLAASAGLTRAARDHARDQGSRGATGHDGADGSSPFARMQRYGSWAGSAAENIAYGSAGAREVVMQLIIDDGVGSRGHRRNIFNPAFAVAGAACAPHAQYRVVCVIDYAQAFTDAGQAK